jgi:hypothetical protein
MIIVQIITFLFLHDWGKTLHIWPLQAIVANIFCFLYLVHHHRKNISEIKKLYTAPFKKAPYFKSRDNNILFRQLPKKRVYLRNSLVFLTTFTAVGIPVLFIAIYMGYWIQTVAEVIKMPPLPDLLVYFILIFLPLTQLMAEIPWYYGYCFPGIEEHLKNKTHKPFVQMFAALAITCFFFTLQHSFMPLVFNWQYFLLESLGMFPLILLIGITIRFFPKLTPGILVLHFGLAVSVAIQYLHL